MSSQPNLLEERSALGLGCHLRFTVSDVVFQVAQLIVTRILKPTPLTERGASGGRQAMYGTLSPDANMRRQDATFATHSVTDQAKLFKPQ